MLFSSDPEGKEFLMKDLTRLARKERFDTVGQEGGEKREKERRRGKRAVGRREAIKSRIAKKYAVGGGVSFFIDF